MERRILGVTAVLGLLAPLLVLTSGQAAAQPAPPPPGPPGFSGQPLPVGERVATDKAPTSRVARSDRALLDRSDPAPVPILVKLDYDSTATYAGGVGDLAPTSPSVTGQPLDGSADEQRYDQFAAEKEAAFARELQAVAPGAEIDRSLRTVYGGVAVTVPADKAEAVLGIPGVVAVQQDKLNRTLTDSSSEFIGAPTVYQALGAAVPNAGQGTILGNLDSGVWPEHPSLADQGNLPAPPGPARECTFGDNPLTPEADPFACQNKLIGGAWFTKAYDAQVGDDPYAGTARDSEGHGNHTATTSAGNVVEDVSVLGSDLGRIHGIAPGAHVMEYKVCGPQGCLSSDTAAAVGQAILDGVDVINYSISGGTDPFTDATELAFLDAYAAGVFVSASAGNDGPGAGTANHLAPWTTSVAASTQRREFASTLTLTAADGATFTAEGATITAGAGPLPVVLASAAPYGKALCDAPAPAGTFDGKIVACERGGNSRVSKGDNVRQGGAAGMVLYNPALADTATDNHWLPAVHLADGTGFLAFMNAHTDVTGAFTAGAPKQGKGDVMAAFSSRGPGGPTIKPDVTAPGVSILAGHTPTPDSVDGGPPGELYQAISGTSMSSPHVAGAALLLRALHPDWTPGQIRSALMTTATTAVVKEDLTTPADPFDLGAGRIDLTRAGSPALTFDETAENMALLGADPLTAVNLNIPSISAPVLPGSLTVTRRAVNVTDRTARYRTEAIAPGGSSITVEPRNVTVPPGGSVDLKITITSPTPDGVQRFGEVRLVPRGADGTALHLPVAFVPQQGSVTLASSCDPPSILRNATTECRVTAENTSFTDTVADLSTTADRGLRVTGATGAPLFGDRVEVRGAALRGSRPGVPAVDPGASPAGYLPIDQFGIPVTPIGDEEFVNVPVPAFVYAGKTYTTIAVSSNGFVKAGEATSEDNNCCNLPAGPDAAPPNAMLAPFWSDLDGTGAPGVLIGTLTDGTNDWIVVEHRVNVFGTTDLKVFQTWIGTNGTEDVSFAYDPANLPTAPAAPAQFLVGAENEVGQGDVEAVAPTGDLRVTSSDPTPGDSVSYTVTVQGDRTGFSAVRSRLTSPLVPGETTVATPVEVRRGR